MKHLQTSGRKMESTHDILKNRVLLLISAAFFVACSTKEKYNSELAVKEFYERAKEREKELYIFFNVAFTARGLNDDGTFFIDHFSYTSSESKSIALPVIETGRSRQDVIASEDYKNVREYARVQSITESQALDYITEVPKLANELKIGKVFSLPRQGKFIVFSLSHKDEVMYVPDTSKVYSAAWKKFIRTGKQLDEKWYYKRTDKSETN